mgnify:FL=1
MSIVALIPARSGSVRIPNKNIRELAGHPLMAYSIAAARESGIFDRVIVSSDSEKYLEVALRYGADCHFEKIVGDRYDYKWIDQVLNRNWDYRLNRPEYFAILRPTSPFRSVETIRRCFTEWNWDKYDSIRAVEPVSQHPGKMWVVREKTMYPLLPAGPVDPPWHSSPTQNLPQVYIQNASLEMASLEAFNRTKTISGWKIQAFFTDSLEGYDLNSEYDWEIAKKLIRDGEVNLPEIP